MVLGCLRKTAKREPVRGPENETNVCELKKIYPDFSDHGWPRTREILACGMLALGQRLAVHSFLRSSLSTLSLNTDEFKGDGPVF